jgi:septum formation protein
MNRLILASKSKVRADLLRAAGISFTTVTADVDEACIRENCIKKDMFPGAVAVALAAAKALAVAQTRPQDFVLGCDQVLAFEGEIVAKSENLAEARALLQKLRGKPHRLVSAAVLVKGGTVCWQTYETAVLHMRSFDDAFLDFYLQAESTEILSAVGSYRLEGRGIQLFDRVEGDYFTVLGLPLMPLMGALREEGLIP